MVLEMLLIALVPLGNQSLVFYAFLLNRILSGAAEALASGADEALAYDALVESNQAEAWPKVLESLMRWSALGFILAHNHPSGVAEPSRADIRLTRRLGDALALLDVRVLDHIVIGAGDGVSLAERGLL